MTKTRFQKVSRFSDIDIPMPSRATFGSAGYDLYVAEDIIIPPLDLQQRAMLTSNEGKRGWMTLDELGNLTKAENIRPTLVSTGVKCYLEIDEYLSIHVRSSTPLKYWLILANSEGICDADYVDNPENEGEIYMQLVNLSPFHIQLKKGDRIGQAIIHKFERTADDPVQDMSLRDGGFGSTDA